MAMHPLVASLLAAIAQAIVGPVRRNVFRGPTPPKAKRQKFGYAEGIVNAARVKRLKEVERKHPLRDEHGAYTLAGRPRRKWLAGISQQRGF